MLAEHQFNPVPAQCLAERPAQRCRLTGKHAIGALDDHRLAAEPTHHLGQFDARGPAAEHQQTARDGLHRGRLAGAPDSIKLAESRNRRHRRRRAGRDDNVVRGVADTVDFDHAWAGQPARAPQQVNAAIGEPALLARIGVTRHHEVTPRQRGRHVDLRARAGLAGALNRLAGPQQRLRGNARPVGALAADQLALNHGDMQPARSQGRGAVLARCSAAQNNHVIGTHSSSTALTSHVALVRTCHQLAWQP